LRASGGAYNLLPNGAQALDNRLAIWHLCWVSSTSHGGP
jgi:hypothetical protein